jgi:hypothetical protein
VVCVRGNVLRSTVVRFRVFIAIVLATVAGYYFLGGMLPFSITYGGPHDSPFEGSYFARGWLQTRGLEPEQVLDQYKVDFVATFPHTLRFWAPAHARVSAAATTLPHEANKVAITIRRLGLRCSTSFQSGRTVIARCNAPLMPSDF